MTFEVELTATAEDDLGRLDATVADRVVAKLRWLAENADQIRTETLSAGGGPAGASSGVETPGVVVAGIVDSRAHGP